MSKLLDFDTVGLELRRVIGSTILKSANSIAAAAGVLGAAARSGRMIYTCGNGGSAAIAAHMVEELMGKFSVKRFPIKAVCLNADATMLTCIANDFGWEAVFARQIAAMGQPREVLVSFSTSGDSLNVISAINQAHSCGMANILVRGMALEVPPGTPGRSFVINVPSTNTARIQEVHTLIMHYFLERIEAVLDGSAETNEGG
jgi:D-sedoheptulose 7-phosphate isomerase